MIHILIWDKRKSQINEYGDYTSNLIQVGTEIGTQGSQDWRYSQRELKVWSKKLHMIYSQWSSFKLHRCKIRVNGGCERRGCSLLCFRKEARRSTKSHDTTKNSPHFFFFSDPNNSYTYIVVFDGLWISGQLENTIIFKLHPSCWKKKST